MYLDKLKSQFDEERLYLKNKMEEERINFELLMEKIQTKINSALDRMEKLVIDNWNSYNKEAQKHLDSEKDYNQLIEHFS